MELPAAACWLVAIGGFTNPGALVIAAFKADFWRALRVKVYIAASFIVATVGFLWAATVLFKSLG